MSLTISTSQLLEMVNQKEVMSVTDLKGQTYVVNDMATQTCILGLEDNSAKQKAHERKQAEA